MLTEKDQEQLRLRGISEQKVNEQLQRFKIGFPYLRLADSARKGNGILQLSAEQEKEALERWEKYLKDGGSVAKFVPASGAASRMFKALFEFVNSSADKPAPGSDVDKILNNLEQLPFYGELNSVLVKNTGRNALELKSDGRYKDIVEAIIGPKGLNYGNLPKGVLSFHRYSDNEVRTPVEEQMIEGAQTASSAGNVKLHFTVSGAHRKLFADQVASVRDKLENRYGVKYDVSFSEQKPSTDTIAANPDDTPFRDDSGNLVFRPGGHGALIENLSDIDATVVFIKNIDNVVPDGEREITIRYKKVLAGVLILIHDRIEKYLRQLESDRVGEKDVDDMLEFLKNTLCISRDGVDELSLQEKISYIQKKLDRPVRVCGMVVNEGEPGGGPYVAYNADGTSSPQILESTQIDTNDSAALELMTQAKYFNPVDLVCYLSDINGQKYNLTDYVDPETGFISRKSAGGRELKALELPGLWNGAMSDWSTVFVEVPAATFNPVKTVNDLLRPVHQADKI